MKCCANIICGVQAPVHLGQFVTIGPVLDSSAPERSGCCAFFNAAELLSAARTGGISSWGCLSARRQGLSSKTSRFGRTCYPSISKSYSFHWKGRVCLMIAKAEKDEHGIKEASDNRNEETNEVANIGPPITVKKSAFFTSPDFFVQLGIFVLAAGFVDAGFSGDWSRIGVLSKQTEDELQWAAIGVVPLAATLIWSISKRTRKLGGENAFHGNR